MKNNTWNYTLINTIYKIVLIAFILMIIFMFQCLFSPAEEFTYETSHQMQFLSFRGDSPLTTIKISEQVVPLSFDVSIKTAYIWTFIIKIILTTGLSLYLLKGIIALAESYIIKKKRFEIKHEQFLRNAALLVFIASWSLNLILHLMLFIETKTFSLELNHMVYVPGLVLAIVFNIFAEVLKHGIVLQEEYDTTL